jgi:hypothetical protein
LDFDQAAGQLLLGINKILHMKNPEERSRGKRALGALVAMVFCAGLSLRFLQHYDGGGVREHRHAAGACLAVMALPAAR